MTRTVLNAPEGYEWMEYPQGWRSQGSELIISGITSKGNIVQVRFDTEGKDIWRIRFVPDGSNLPDLPMVVSKAGVPVALNTTENANEITAEGTRLTLHVTKEPWCLNFTDESGKIVFRENPYDVDGINRLVSLPLGFVKDLEGKIAQVSESVHIAPDEHLFGLGEKFTALDKKGQRITSWNVDALGAASEAAYKNVPLLISTQGYGLFINTGRKITYNLGNQSCETYSISLDGYYLDLYLIYGPTPLEILDKYSLITGRAPVPPRWSFGLWLSGGIVHQDEEGIRQLVNGLAKYDIPCDVIHVDPWWMRPRRYADFQWNNHSFPDPAGLAGDIHKQGLRLSFWQHPYMSIESELFEVGKQNGYFAKKMDGEVYVFDYGLSLASMASGVSEVGSSDATWNARVAAFDITNPEAVEWYKSLMRPILETGVDVFKTDFGEDIPVDACFANGMTGAEMHNLYPLYYNKVVFELIQEQKGKGIVWARSGTAGSQRYPVCWSGDPACTWESLAFTIRGGLSLGMSGVPFWSNDIGGFRGQPSEKLYIRWAQFGLFCSHARCHGETLREPWAYGNEAVTIFRQYVSLRYQLFPYLYSCAFEATWHGVPVMQAMPLAFPSDENGYNKDFQYLFGPSLLVAPIYNENDQRLVYVPEGQWINYWTLEKIAGPRTIRITAPLDRLPIYVRGGAIIPMMEKRNRIPSGTIDPLILVVYPHGLSQYVLNEDEGSTIIHCQEKSTGIEIDWNGKIERRMTILLKIQNPPTKVIGEEMDGRPGVECQWMMDETGALRIQVGKTNSGRIWVER